MGDARPRRRTRARVDAPRARVVAARRELHTAHLARHAAAPPLRACLRRGGAAWRGVPPQHRPQVWLSLSGARELRRASAHSYWELARRAEAAVPHEILRQVEYDLPRTFPQHADFAGEMSEDGRAEGTSATAAATLRALRRVLLAFAAYNPSVGYCQSLNFVAAVLMLVCGEEGAFWTLAALCAHVIPDYHTHGMSGLRIDTQAVAALVGQMLPELDRHFHSLGVPVEILASQWFLSLFANVLPSGTLLRVWDAVFAGGGVDSLAAAMVATLRRHQDAILQTEDIAEVYALLAAVTPAMWRADLVLTDMQAAALELDPGGLRWAEMRRQREAQRRQQLQALLDETGLQLGDVAPLLGLSLGAPHPRTPATAAAPPPAYADKGVKSNLGEVFF
eukprot:Transcript_7572.p2 GENE.Transcript_7572~~Transcript_7572.p2  ORF type:complete len:393 (-),score=159.14 Transcript_7572:13-1191(-)